MVSGKALGEMGEKAARSYLEGIGYQIIQANYRDKLGELDLVAFDDKVLAFIEVKTRRSTRYGRPCEAVDRIKQKKIAKVALSYLAKNKILHKQIRFDVVEVIIWDNQVRQIRLVKDAFDTVR